MHTPIWFWRLTEVILCKILKSQFWAEYYQARNEAQVLYLYKPVDRATDHGDNYWAVFVADFFVKPFIFEDAEVADELHVYEFNIYPSKHSQWLVNDSIIIS